MTNKTYQHLISSHCCDLVLLEILRLHPHQILTPLLDGSTHHSEEKISALSHYRINQIIIYDKNKLTVTVRHTNKQKLDSDPTFVCLFVLYVPVNKFYVTSGHFPVFLGWTSAKQRIECRPRTQCSASVESRTTYPSISSQTLYQWATTLQR